MIEAQGNERTEELNRRLDLVLNNKKAIEDKLNGNGIDSHKRKCLEYQLTCLKAPIDRFTTQIMETV